VQQILRGGRHLLALIDEVLDIARIETDRLQLAIEPVSLRELIQECLDLIGPLAATRDLRLHANLCELQLPMVQADRQRLKQVLLNLLSNAVKYNHAGGLVRLTTSINGNDQLRLEIQDTGIGILPNKLPRLFEPFDRLGAEQSDVEGTGLGLALTKRLVDAMGATIGVDSSPGHGSTFWLELPIVAHVLSDAKASDTDCGAGLLVPAAGRPAVVLYIEDNTANFRLVERMLELREGFTFIGAIQGGLGIELAREHQPDLICLDLNLPDLPGEEVLDRLKADPRTAHIPVIVISADAIPQRVEQLMLSGAVAYLTKPLELDQFLAAVDLIAAS
jgi:CheY-like chemotaxis protein/anti-sigma regulatory factor (Ser/Thr protein kinase)